MLWRKIPPPSDVLSRPTPPVPPRLPRLPPPSAPPADATSDDDGEVYDITPSTSTSRRRSRRFSFHGDAPDRPVKEVKKEKKKDTESDNDLLALARTRSILRDDERNDKAGGGLGRILRRRKSVGEFLGLVKREKVERDESNEPPLVTSFMTRGSEGSPSSDGSGSEEESVVEDDARMGRRAAQGPVEADLRRRIEASRTRQSSPEPMQRGQGHHQRRPSSHRRPSFSAPPQRPLPPRRRSPSPRRQSTSRVPEKPYCPPPPDYPSVLPPLPKPPVLPYTSRSWTLPPPRPPLPSSSSAPSVVSRTSRKYENRLHRRIDSTFSRPFPPQSETAPFSFSRGRSSQLDSSRHDGGRRRSPSTSSSRSGTPNDEGDFSSDAGSSLEAAPRSASPMSSESSSVSSQPARPPLIPPKPFLSRSQTLPPPRPPLPTSFAQPPPRPPLPPPSHSPPNPPVFGLKNVGNTCFLNVVLQCLFSTEPLAEFFLNGAYEKELNSRSRTKGELAREVACLFRDALRGRRRVADPSSLRSLISTTTSQFSEHEQHDAHELLLWLLDHLHNDLNLVSNPPSVKPNLPAREAEIERLPEAIAAGEEWTKYRARKDSVVIDFFEGQERNRMECLTCLRTSTTFSPLQTLSLSIPPLSPHSTSVSLTDCINHFLAEEILDGENAWSCPSCQRPRATSKRLSVCRLPQFLIIHVKRFVAFDSFSSKIDTPVAFPLDGLSLGHLLPPRTFDYQGLSSPHEERTTYELYGVCTHLGDDGDGHYKAIVRRADRWYEVDDALVAEVTERDVRATARDAYLLFFRISR